MLIYLKKIFFEYNNIEIYDPNDNKSDVIKKLIYFEYYWKIYYFVFPY